jgi:hypothetical protein
LFDGDGLYLLVSTTGHWAWRFKYYIVGKEASPHATRGAIYTANQRGTRGLRRLPLLALFN